MVNIETKELSFIIKELFGEILALNKTNTSDVIEGVYSCFVIEGDSKNALSVVTSDFLKKGTDRMLKLLLEDLSNRGGLKVDIEEMVISSMMSFPADKMWSDIFLDEKLHLFISDVWSSSKPYSVELLESLAKRTAKNVEFLEDLYLVRILWPDIYDDAGIITTTPETHCSMVNMKELLDKILENEI